MLLPRGGKSLGSLRTTGELGSEMKALPKVDEDLPEPGKTTGELLRSFVDANRAGSYFGVSLRPGWNSLMLFGDSVLLSGGRGVEGAEKC